MDCNDGTSLDPNACSMADPTCRARSSADSGAGKVGIGTTIASKCNLYPTGPE